MIKFLILFLFISCQKFIDSSKNIIGLSNRDENKKTVSTTNNYIPPVAPTYDQDLVVKTDPRQKFLSLMDAFIKQPDLQMKELVVQEFKKFAPSFGDQLDKDLASILEKIKNEFNQQNNLHLLLMYQMSLELRGENKVLAQNLLAMGFDLAPRLMLEVASKKTLDSSCDIVLLVREMDKEDKKNIIKSRYQTLQELKADLLTDQRLLGYLEVCQGKLKAEFQKLSQITESTVEEIVPPEAPTTTP